MRKTLNILIALLVTVVSYSLLSFGTTAVVRGTILSDTTWDPIIVIFQNEYGQKISKWVKGSHYVAPGSQPPIALVGDDQLLPVTSTSTTLNGASSYDPDGSIVSYKWTQISGTTVPITSPNSAITTVTGLVQGHTYVFRLTVTDDDGITASNELEVFVTSLGEYEYYVTDSAYFNFTPVAQNVDGWVDVAGEPTQSVLTATASNGWSISTVGTDTTLWRGEPLNSDSAALRQGMVVLTPDDPFGYKFPKAVEETGFTNTYSDFVPGTYNLVISGLSSSQLYSIRILGSYMTDASNAVTTNKIVCEQLGDSVQIVRSHLNTSAMAVFDTVKPTAEGKIRFSITGADSTLWTAAASYGYDRPMISGMKVLQISKTTDQQSSGVVGIRRTYYDSRIFVSDGVDELPVLVYKPYNYDPDKKYSLVFFMGGNGSKAINRQWNLQFQLTYDIGLVAESEEGKIYGIDENGDTVSYVLAIPQLDLASTYSLTLTYSEDKLKQLIANFKTESSFNFTDSLYLIGVSAGSGCVARYLFRYPKGFEGAMVQSSFIRPDNMRDSAQKIIENGGRIFVPRRVDQSEAFADSMRAIMPDSLLAFRWWGIGHSGFMWEYSRIGAEFFPIYNGTPFDFFANKNFTKEPEHTIFAIDINNTNNTPDYAVNLVADPSYLDPSDVVVTATDPKNGYTLSTVSTSVWDAQVVTGLDYPTMLYKEFQIWPTFMHPTYMLGTGCSYSNFYDGSFETDGPDLELSGLDPNTHYQIWVVSNAGDGNTTVWSTNIDSIHYVNSNQPINQNWRMFEGVSDSNGKIGIGMYGKTSSDYGAVNGLIVIKR